MCARGLKLSRSGVNVRPERTSCRDITPESESSWDCERVVDRSEGLSLQRGCVGYTPEEAAGALHFWPPQPFMKV